MQLLQQLNEQASDLHVAQQLISAVVQAAPFFHQRRTDTQWLYRGLDLDMHPKDGLVTFHVPRRDRRPKDSSMLLHKALDRKFIENFHVPYRSEGVFATGSMSDAQSYGAPAIILPQGQFTFCWGRQVPDAFTAFNGQSALMYLRDNAHTMGEGLSFPATIDRSTAIDFIEQNEWARTLFDQWVDSEYEDGQYTDKDLPAAIDSLNEIMVHCDEYAVITPQGVSLHQVGAAEHLLATSLDLDSRPSIQEFMTAISRKAIPSLGY